MSAWSVSNGLSPAGKRIAEAGRRYQQSVADKTDKTLKENETRRREAMFRKREAAVQMALDSYSTKGVPSSHVGEQRLRSIIEETGDWHGFSYVEMMSVGRQRALCNARFEAMWRCAAETTRSLPEIGRAFQKDHTSVLHGIRRHAEMHGLPLPRGMTPGTK